jgi:hypothetical protein
VVLCYPWNHISTGSAEKFSDLTVACAFLTQGFLSELLSGVCERHKVGVRTRPSTLLGPVNGKLCLRRAVSTERIEALALKRECGVGTLIQVRLMGA